MSLSKKKSRPIRVDDMGYRYIISTTRLDEDWNFKLNVTIQASGGKSAVLMIKGLVTRDFWLDFSDPPRSNDNYPILLPNHVEKFIRKAIENGWNPKEKGAPFILTLDNKSVFNGASDSEYKGD